jgi:C1A family cysteine protease
LLDCVGGSSKGCNGGFTEDGFDYVSDEGIRTLDDAPFEAEDGFCETSDDKKYFTQSWAQYVSSDEERIMSEVLTNGSVSAVFEVFADFFTYAGGVYSHVTGDYAGLHAVVLTGWGESEEEGKWWIVRNSWGEDFGEGGYFRIKRGLDENGCNFEGGLTTAMIKVDK